MVLVAEQWLVVGCVAFSLSMATGVLANDLISEKTAARQTQLGVKVVAVNGNRNTYLHGARVTIELSEPLPGRAGLHSVSTQTGNAGYADIGRLSPSSVVGHYRVIVEHPRCGELVQPRYWLADSSRPQTLTLKYLGACR